MPTQEQLVAAVMSGQLSLNDIRAQVGRPAVGVDESNWTSDPTMLAQRIAAIYGNAGASFTPTGARTPPPTGIVPGQTPGTYVTGETEAQRIARIVADIAAGRMTLQDLRNSLYGAAGLPMPSDLTGVFANDAATVAGGAAAIEARVRQMFANTGQSIATVRPATDGLAQNGNTESMRAVIERILADYGLSELNGWAWQQLTAGKPIDLILLELEQQPAFQAMFPEIGAIRSQNASGSFNRVVPKPAEILEYRQTAGRLFANAGIGYLADRATISNLIIGGVSPSELQFRVNDAFLRAKDAPLEMRSAFADFFGVSGDAALAAWFLDPTRATSVLEQQLGAASLGGASTRFGFTLSAAGAQAAQQRYGISTFDQAAQGIGQVYRLRGLLDETVTEYDDYTFGDEGLDTAFGGPGGDRLRRRLDERTAAFSGGGGALLTQQGLAVGTAS